MPFFALRDGERVIPEGVDDGTDVTCLECGEKMYVWGPATDGTARHFKHHSDRDCQITGGESATHRKLKSIAVSKLRQLFGERATVCEPEVTVDAPVSDATARRADAFVRFENRDEQFGKGLIIEVQYKNRGKNKRATERDYLAQDYSVVWVTPDAYADNRLLHNEVTLRQAASEVSHEHFHRLVELPRGAPDPVADTLDLSLSDSVVPATVIKGWVIQTPREHWEDRGWDAAFTSPSGGYPAREHILRGLAGSLPTTTPPAASLPEPAADMLRYKSDQWVRQKQTGAEFYQPIVFDPTLPYGLVYAQLSKPDKLMTADLSRPPTRFDDVQCLGCGNYQYAPNAGRLCPECNKPYDWDWNVETGRIKESSVPEDLSIY